MALFVAQFLIALLLSGNFVGGLSAGPQARGGDPICWIDWGVARERHAVVRAVWKARPTGTGADQLASPGTALTLAAPRGGLTRACVAAGRGAMPPPSGA